MSEGLCARLLPGSYRATAKTREFASMSLCAMARLVLARQGRTGYTGPGQIAAAALRLDGTRAAPESYLTTDDFVDVLLNLARAALTEGYTVAPRTFTSWCRATTLQDFRTTWRIALGAGPLLEKVPQHAEYQRGQMPSRAEAIQLETWGKILPFSRQAMVNDDLGMLARIPQMFGHSAATMEGDVVYGVLTSNPVMSDGHALFSAAHANVGTPSAIDLASLAEARRLMRTQTSPEGAPLNLEPRFLIVGPEKEVEALQLTASLVVPTTLGPRFRSRSSPSRSWSIPASRARTGTWRRPRWPVMGSNTRGSPTRTTGRRWKLATALTSMVWNLNAARTSARPLWSGEA
jgi:hypothetical protein